MDRRRAGWSNEEHAPGWMNRMSEVIMTWPARVKLVGDAPVWLPPKSLCVRKQPTCQEVAPDAFQAREHEYDGQAFPAKYELR